MSVSNVGSVHAQIHQELIEENEKLTKQLEVLKKENERLKGIEKDHRTDWMRIQNAERKCEDLQKENEGLRKERDDWKERAVTSFDFCKVSAAERKEFEYLKKITEEKYSKLNDTDKKLAEAVKALEFYGNPETWIKRTKNNWYDLNPKDAQDGELIRNYEHPGTDWKSTIKVGGKLARETLNKIRGEK